MKVFFSDRYIVETGSPVPIDKLAFIKARLDTYRGFDVREPRAASYEDLARVHERGYINAVRDGRPIDLATSQGFVWTPELFDAVSLTSGGTIDAAYSAMEDGVAGNIACGFHHARRERGEGYCTFNGIAVAIRKLQEEGRINRALVVDGDLHFGNGTARIFHQDDTVFTFSVYGQGTDPIRETPTNRKAYVRNWDEYRYALGEVPGIIDRFSPDLIIYQASVDPYCQDPFSNLNLTEKDLKERDKFVFRQGREREIPIAFVLGGGYGRPGYKLLKVVKLHTNTFLEARSLFELQRV